MEDDARASLIVTIRDIDPALWYRARLEAGRRKWKMAALVERGLRLVLEEARAEAVA